MWSGLLGSLTDRASFARRIAGPHSDWHRCLGMEPRVREELEEMRPEAAITFGQAIGPAAYAEASRVLVHWSGLVDSSEESESSMEEAAIEP